MQKTLGGDRLGSGKRMKVNLSEYGRSNHDLGFLWRSTMSAGTVVPFLSIIGLPGDTFDINLDVDIKTHPTVGPLFGGAKIQLDTFEIPIRLYNAMLHNNKIGVGMDISKVLFPRILVEGRGIPEDIRQTLDMDNAVINPSSLLAYAGIRGPGFIEESEGLKGRKFNAIPILGYWEIMKNYYCNKQETNAYVIHTVPEIVGAGVDSVLATLNADTIPQFPGTTGNFMIGNNKQITVICTGPATEEILDSIKLNTSDGGTQWKTLRELMINYTIAGTDIIVTIRTGALGIWIYSWDYVNQFELRQGMPKLTAFPLENIDAMREEILEHRPFSSEFIINQNPIQIAPYMWLGWDNTHNINFMLGSQEGLGVKTYQSDLFNNWLNTEWIDGVSGINARSAVDTSGGSFTMDQLLISEKVFDYLNRVMVSGGSYDDWLDATYTVERYERPESPVYHGSLIRELMFQEVVSNSESAEGQQPLGTLAGKGIMTSKRKGGKMVIKPKEPCYIMGLISITPRVDYSQGNSWDTHLMTMDDLHKPALDQIGFQDLITEQMAWWDTYWDSISPTPAWRQRSAGKQPAWINYMTAVNKTLGNFAIIDNEMFMTFNRRYEWNGSSIGDLTTYIDPAKFNFIFADTASDAQNYWAQIAVDIEARRIMSAKIMPNL